MEVSDSFKIAGVTEDALRLKLFPYSLRDRERAWLNSLPPSSISTWQELAERFLLETFYNGLNAHTRLMVDASADGAILSKSYNEAYEIIERITSNNYQWPTNRTALGRRVVGVHKVDALTSLSAQVSSISSMLKQFTANTTNNL
ncbi:hypothetical protein PVK06_001857 [Gossypium arboreum]|uniref:Retrotransposon gag domain-containing protein n=1 Tax=Gossypium arboreum TaxID=29729 RepID=A0ABR0R394_GOSAR|nr:hypothetical protein PVK06_001857 [Gossypium arboreum]